MDVLGAAQRMVDHARRDRRIRRAVDQDEAAQGDALVVSLEHDRAVGIDLGQSDIVERQRVGRAFLLAVDVDDMAGRLHGRADQLRAELERIASSRHQRRIGHPDDLGDELVGYLEGGSLLPQ